MSENKSIIQTGNRGLQLTSLDEMYRFCQYVVKSGLIPRGFDTAEKVLIAVQTGYELGITPLMALQNMMVINGIATMYGDLPLALVRASDVCDYVKESFEGDGEQLTAICISKRKDSPEEYVTKFSVQDAKDSGLLNKNDVWKKYKKRMFQFRARTWNLRDNFGDVLKGVRLAEEVTDYEQHSTSAIVAEQPTDVVVPELETTEVVEIISTVTEEELSAAFPS